jgi:hypothetical protein
MSLFASMLRAAGVSRPWLAARTGRTRSAVDRWCDGTARPPAEVVEWLQRRLTDLPPRLPPDRRFGGRGGHG